MVREGTGVWQEREGRRKRKRREGMLEGEIKRKKKRCTGKERDKIMCRKEKDERKNIEERKEK